VCVPHDSGCRAPLPCRCAIKVAARGRARRSTAITKRAPPISGPHGFQGVRSTSSTQVQQRDEGSRGSLTPSADLPKLSHHGNATFQAGVAPDVGMSRACVPGSSLQGRQSYP
jgi:hypothetical protein